MPGFFETLKLIIKFWGIIQNIISFYKRKDAEKWEANIEQDFLNYQDLVTAKTLEERKLAEKKVASDWLRK